MKKPICRALSSILITLGLLVGTAVASTAGIEPPIWVVD